MSMFKRDDKGNGKQNGAGSETHANGSEQATSGRTARDSAPGVVPPPAAPIYSMRPPASAQRGDGLAMRARASAGVGLQRTRSAAMNVVAGRRQLTMQVSSRAVPQTPGEQFDPERFAQAALLNIAWRFQQVGAPIRAIHTYLELLSRYPDSAAADAAVADLADLSGKLAEAGQFHMALGIYDQLEDLMSEC